jgi:PD-(D/E)XK nuclease superfamily
MKKAKVEEAYAIGLQPSGSRSDILIHCSYPFGKDVGGHGPSEPADYGTAFHALMAQRLAKSAKKPKLPRLRPRLMEELSAHVPAAYRELQDWLKGHNPFRTNFNAKGGMALIEAAIALHPFRGGRVIEAHDSDHRYHGIQKGEIASTLDLGIIPAKAASPMLILDHKTGEGDFSRPERLPQLLTLALAALRMTRRKEVIVGVLHAPRRGMPHVYAEKVQLHELEKHEHLLVQGLERIEDGSLRPGPWCKWCPAKEICPSQDSELLAKAGDMLTGLTAAGGALSKNGFTANDIGAGLTKVSPGTLSRDKKLGLLYSIAKKARRLAERVNDEIKKEILQDPSCMPETPDGEYLVVREYDRETLSKASLATAYGSIQAERMIAKMRLEGATRVSKIQQLYPEKERGR